MNEQQDRLSTSQGLQLCRLRDEYARPRSYMVVALASFALVAGATVPTPLYQLYREAFHFSNFMLTVVFGIYAFGVIPALLAFGPIGDAICRRRVLIAAICTEVVGIVVLAAARDVHYLLVGRLLVGVAVGASQGNSSAALVEMQPRGDRRQAGIMITASTIGGAATGTLVSGLLAQYLPNPLLLPYLLELGLLAAALVMVSSIQEAAAPALSFIRIHRPRVPRAIAAGFAAASLSGGLAFSIAGLFLALVPSYVSSLLQAQNLAAGGALVALMLGSSIVAQVILGSYPIFRLQAGGLGGAVAGLAAVVIAWHLSSLLLMCVGSIVCGASIGMAYLGSVAEINRLAEPDARGSVNSLYFMIIYLFFAVPAIALGFAATHLGLYRALWIFSAIISTLAIGEIAWLTIHRWTSARRLR